METPRGLQLPTSTVPDSERPQRHFQCSVCKRSFTRVDHLSRHVRSHTRQKPYVCPKCSKGFARADLLKRHVANHSAVETGKRQRRDTVRQSRVVQACEACSQNHLRCEDEKPCSRCQQRGIECRVPGNGNELDEVHAAQDLLDLRNNSEHYSATPDEVLPDVASSQMPTAEQPAHQYTPTPIPAPSIAPEYYHQHDINGPAPGIYVENDSPQYRELQMTEPPFPEYLRHMPLFEASLPGHATPRGLLDLSFDWDLNLNDLDLGLLDRYNFQVPFNAETSSTHTQGFDLSPREDPTQDSVTVRAEAFKRSIWRFLPQSNRDYGSAEQPNLAFHDTETSRNRACITSRRAIEERLQRVHRDKLFSLVLSTCNPATVPRISSAFPSVELLDGLMQYFLTAPSLNAKFWFHLPTFSPSQLRPELLGSIIAAGAVSTPDVALRKLGFALQEASRSGNAKCFEEDNTSIRDLQHLQSVLLQLEVGMWSGISRKMEIAESFLQPLVTMLRRGGRFRQSMWKEIVPAPTDEGSVLEEKWRAWVQQEAYLRLVYRTIEHDTQSSLALLKPPLISYSEMQAPLPHAEGMWHANSATAWKSACLNHHSRSTKRPLPADCLANTEDFSHHEVASSVYLCMTWGMIWEYGRMSALMAKSPLKSNSSQMILTSRHQELTKQLEDFRLRWSDISKGAEISLELIMMQLNAPLEDIQLLAGIEGQEEAQRAYPALRDWVLTASARQALWHAGQIVHTAEVFPKGLLCNFNAIAVYHAGLVFWVYGLLKRNQPSDPSNLSDFVDMNGDETRRVQQFIALDRGLPCIRNHGSQTAALQIGDVSGVMDRLVQLLRSNHDLHDGSLPPLVDNLVQLMKGLRAATS